MPVERRRETFIKRADGVADRNIAAFARRVASLFDRQNAFGDLIGEIRFRARNGRRSVDRIGGADQVLAGNRGKIDTEHRVELLLTVGDGEIAQGKHGVPLENAVFVAKQPHETVEVRIERFWRLFAHQAQQFARGKTNARSYGTERVNDRQEQLRFAFHLPGQTGKIRIAPVHASTINGESETSTRAGIKHLCRQYGPWATGVKDGGHTESVRMNKQGVYDWPDARKTTGDSCAAERRAGRMPALQPWFPPRQKSFRKLDAVFRACAQIIRQEG